MPIEVDQSNKVERTEKDTILAFANEQCAALVIPARIKRQALEHLIERGKPRKVAYLMIFAAGLFLLLRDYLAQPRLGGERIIIDTEYSGQEANIRAMLLRHAQRLGLALSSERIIFAQVGKKSNAHNLAWRVQRGKTVPEYWVTLQDLLGLL